MDTSKIKAYAPQARRDFIQTVTDKANIYGLSGDNNDPAEIKGDVAIIAGQAYSKKIGQMQQRLTSRVKSEGFEQVMEAIAYTWFNRFIALRYMEIHDYLDHGYRVLSNRGDSDIPEILEEATNVDLPGLDKDKVVEYRLAGYKDNELYQMLVLAQCNALHRTMPFLFERIDDETELLIPDNLLHSNSPIRKLVNEIDESEWINVEIIGWIYQFYISEKKDQVIGKVVKSEDIPSATQLFTPNWIVKYMVQNTLGRLWLSTYPDSNIRDKMEYYIEPAEQEPEIQEQLDAIIPEELNPEEITFLDPACGSGHILVEAYDIFKEIYIERGYRTRDIPLLIIEKNLYGLDIDDRAAQLACFAILIKARRDDRRILSRDNVKLNVMAIQEAMPLDVSNVEIFFKGDEYKTIRSDLNKIVSLFEKGKTFGSLITIPDHLVQRMERIGTTVNNKIGKWILQSDVQNLVAIVKQARILAEKYDCVVTNPPYMGRKGMNSGLNVFAKDRFPNSKSDLFAMFIERNLNLVVEQGVIAMITMQSWMFLSSFEKLREKLLDRHTFLSMAHFGARAFDSIGGEVVSTTAFVLQNAHQAKYKGANIRLVDGNSESEKRSKILEAIKNPDCGWFFRASNADFKKIPGSPIAYWVKGTSLFEQNIIGDKFVSGGRNKTHNNEKYLRFFWEIDNGKLNWVPYANGGDFRKYYGNELHVVDWSEEARKYYDSHGGLCNSKFWGKEGITWSLIASARSSFRIKQHYVQYSSGSPTIFNNEYKCDLKALAFLNSPISRYYLKALNPTINTTVNDVFSLPFVIEEISQSVDSNVEICMINSKSDWDIFETSIDFVISPFLQPEYRQSSLKATYTQFRAHWQEMTLEMQRLEEENNHIFLKAYGLQDELTPEVPLNEITLICNPHYRYGDSKTEEELETLLLTDTIKELISYSTGCMMGRYSLDESGLIYANSGNEGFDHLKYKTFPADDDGIVPVMDLDWFSDDATNRFIEFLKVAWAPDILEENLKFVANCLSPKETETSIDTIRRYLSTKFFKDHIKTYKKKPICWLFSSGKQKAFECLVYLHRYNESTLARMRSAYVTPLQGKFNARIEYLQTEINAAETTSAKKKLQKELEALKKKKTELAAFDDELRHYADMKISLDLDDGVKVNYDKFGSLLAEKKAITGKK